MADREFRELPAPAGSGRSSPLKYRRAIAPFVVAGAAVVVHLVGPASASVWSARGGSLVSSLGNQFKYAASPRNSPVKGKIDGTTADGGAIELLEYISASSGLAVSDIARAAGVTRQAVYGWQKGGTISSKKLEKLHALRGVIAKLLENDFAPDRSTLRRRIGGKSILDSLAADQEVKSVAFSLLEALLSERKQLLATRADRRKPFDELEATKVRDAIGRQTRSI